MNFRAHINPKSGKRYTVSAKKAQMFDKMAENWVRNAERSGNPNDYATAAKQALVSAFYWKHNGDQEAARQQMDRAEWAIARAKGATDKRTLQWIMKNKGSTKKLVFGRLGEIRRNASKVANQHYRAGMTGSNMKSQTIKTHVFRLADGSYTSEACFRGSRKRCALGSGATPTRALAQALQHLTTQVRHTQKRNKR